MILLDRRATSPAATAPAPSPDKRRSSPSASTRRSPSSTSVHASGKSSGRDDGADGPLRTRRYVRARLDGPRRRLLCGARARRGRARRRAAAARPRTQTASTTPGWPGEGQYLFARGGIPTSNYITGPTTSSTGASPRRTRSTSTACAPKRSRSPKILRLGRTPREHSPRSTYRDPANAKRRRLASVVTVVKVLGAGFPLTVGSMRRLLHASRRSRTWGPAGATMPHGDWRVELRRQWLRRLVRLRADRPAAGRRRSR